MFRLTCLLVGCLTLVPAIPVFGAGPFPPLASPAKPVTNLPPARIENLGNNRVRLGKVIVDARARTVTIPAWVNMRRGVLEYALVTRTGKTHESLLATDAQPRDIHAACLLLNARPAPVGGAPDTAAPVPAGSALQIEVEWNERKHTNRAPLATWLAIADQGPDEPSRGLTLGPWLFNGSVLVEKSYLADGEGSIISLIRDPVAVINNPRPERDHDEWHLPAANVVPEAGAFVRVLLSIPPGPLPPKAQPPQPPPRAASSPAP